jgi:hypothetical protein
MVGVNFLFLEQCQRAEGFGFLRIDSPAAYPGREALQTIYENTKSEFYRKEKEVRMPPLPFFYFRMPNFSIRDRYFSISFFARY